MAGHSPNSASGTLVLANYGPTFSETCNFLYLTDRVKGGVGLSSEVTYIISAPILLVGKNHTATLKCKGEIQYGSTFRKKEN